MVGLISAPVGLMKVFCHEQVFFFFFGHTLGSYATEKIPCNGPEVNTHPV